MDVNMELRYDEKPIVKGKGVDFRFAEMTDHEIDLLIKETENLEKAGSHKLKRTDNIYEDWKKSKIETNDESKTVKLREKGSIGINHANKDRVDDIVTKSVQTVHEQCRTNSIFMKGLKRKPSEPVNEPPFLRSEKQYDFKEDCLFCGASVIKSATKRKTFEVHAVRKTEFQKSIEQICGEKNDE
ncbi:unnamed protein product [Mytilus coruscus]|uniref:Uncharacterized protein n=1 Tax=Mytilus coruscus TaxID=42192 RepID=A0A6J8E719_MYTCO|nr:unnamed protein product [Mytilus coruscus]